MHTLRSIASSVANMLLRGPQAEPMVDERASLAPTTRKRLRQYAMKNAKRFFIRTGEVSDTVPIIAQVKSVLQMLEGDKEGALETQKNFTRRCPLVSQLRKRAELVIGNREGAEQTLAEFTEHTWNKLDCLPVVGHLSAMVQMKQNPEQGWAMIERANATVRFLFSLFKATAEDLVYDSMLARFAPQRSLFSAPHLRRPEDLESIQQRAQKDEIDFAIESYRTVCTQSDLFSAEGNGECQTARGLVEAELCGKIRMNSAVFHSICYADKHDEFEIMDSSDSELSMLSSDNDDEEYFPSEISHLFANELNFDSHH